MDNVIPGILCIFHVFYVILTLLCTYFFLGFTKELFFNRTFVVFSDSLRPSIFAIPRPRLRFKKLFFFIAVIVRILRSTSSNVCGILR